jgi:hypothetical protein
LRNQAERAVDQAVDRELAQAELAFLAPALSQRETDRLGLLRSLYQRPDLRRKLNEGYGLLVARWQRSYPRVASRARFSLKRVNAQTLAAEIDERLGAGAFAAMTEEFERSQREALARTALRRQTINALNDYIRRTGRMPPPGSRIEAGRIVEPSQ